MVELVQEPGRTGRDKRDQRVVRHWESRRSSPLEDESGRRESNPHSQLGKLMFCH